MKHCFAFAAFLAAIAAALVLAPSAMAAATGSSAASAAPASNDGAPAALDVITLDPSQTVIGFRLGGDLHTTEGSFQLKSGRITIDPATGAAGGAIVIDSASSTSGNRLRDAEMHDRVLETGAYPQIVFVPKTIHATRTDAGLVQGKVDGTLTIHGAPHPITLDVTGSVTGDVFKCESSFAIPYAAWGMRNPSWLMFRVSDTVNVDITASAKVAWAAPGQSSGEPMTIPAR
jgi:polyisoprenoid-binding protein YceI